LPWRHPSGKWRHSLPSFAPLGGLGQLDRLDDFQNGGRVLHADGLSVHAGQGAEEAIDHDAFRYLSHCRGAYH
jgi:hypothetical protein